MLGKVPITDNPQANLSTAHKQTPHKTAPINTGVLDGIRKPKKATAHTNSPTFVNKQQPTPQLAKLATTKVQKSATLNRATVKKPSKQSPTIHSTSSIANSRVEQSATGRGLLIKRIPDSRLARASKAVKSSAINKFSHGSITKPPILDQNLSVTKAPSSHATSRTATVVRSLHKPKLAKPDSSHKTVFFHPNIENATNHNNPKVPKKQLHTKIIEKFKLNPKIIGASAAVVALLVLGSFLVYQKIPNVALRVANNKAGFQGRMPGTTPAGFAFKGPIQYSKGSITMSFASRSDERNFVLSQKPSDQTSESLLVSEISPSKKRYQTYHDKGLTVYIFNDGNAAWVDKGVQYNIKDNGSLSSEQVLSIAASM